jgi:hypothetical protein
MSKPWIHAESSAKKFGGVPEDYIEIHSLLDSSKAAMCDNRHRALTHNAWFIGTILERVFGVTITNSKGKKVSVRDVGEQHVSEDFRGKFIPSAQDYLMEMEFKDWMNNGKALPPSCAKLEPKVATVRNVIMPTIPEQVYDGSNEPSFPGSQLID